MSKHLIGAAFDTSLIRYAFAYGAAVHRQKGYGADELSRSMLDLMLVVRDPMGFHDINLARNRDHYSAFFRGGPKAGRRWLQEAGAGVLFNTDVKIGTRRAKYGVVSESAFLSDLLHWDTLYLAGRLHKPVFCI